MVGALTDFDGDQGLLFPGPSDLLLVVKNPLQAQSPGVGGVPSRI